MPGEGVEVEACRIWDLGVAGAVVVAIVCVELPVLRLLHVLRVSH